MDQKNDNQITKSCLDAKDIATYLGIGRTSAYALLHRQDFPHIKINEKRLVCPREHFFKWIEQQVEKNMGKEE